MKQHSWKGYDIDELRVRQLVTQARIDIERSKLASAFSTTESKGGSWFRSPLSHKITGALDYMDYAIIAFTVGGRLFKLFKRKK